MKIPFLDLKKQYLNIQKEIDIAIKDVIDNSLYVRGKYVSEFENSFAKANKIKYCCSVANGTDGLIIALKSLGIKQNDEVIVPAQTWVSTIGAVINVGATPVIVDVDEYFTIDINEVEKNITPKTIAIIAVNLFGQSCEMKSLLKLCENFNLKLIEDCAQSHFTKYDSKFSGTMSDIGVFSFYPGKNLGAMGDGGAIITNNKNIYEFTKMYSNHGGFVKHEHLIPGVNSRLDGLQAAILNVKLRYIMEWTNKRNKIAKIFSDQLSNLEEIQTPLIRKNTFHSFHQFVIKTKERDQLKEYLKSFGIDTLLHYPKCIPNLPISKPYINNTDTFKNANQNELECLSLPIYPELTDNQINYLIDKIKDFF
jgi:dTDP-4-amino-4,6-dideoxygalactose transaminase